LAAYAAASESKDGVCSAEELQEAVGVLQQAAAYVKWF
jgi:hypothetical protein